MANKSPIVYFFVAILAVLAVTTAGCSMLELKKDNASIARDIVLSDPGIKGDIAASGGSYSSDVQPADLNATGYLNYSGSFYQVHVDTSNRGPGGPYLKHFDVLVDTESKRMMRIGYRFDVATYPDSILVPGHAAWYRRFQASDMSPAYIGINLSTLNASVRPLVMDEDNFNRLRQGVPFDAWSLKALGENATESNTDGHNAPVVTGISGITAIPGIIPMPGTPFVGHGVKLTFKGPRQYYYVLINDGPADVGVESLVMG